MVNVGINGFGRTGRMILRAALLRGKEMRITAINDPLLTAQEMAYLFKNDTVHGTFKGTIKVVGNAIVVNDWTILVFNEEKPEKIPWGLAKVEIVTESSGYFPNKEMASKHLKDSVKRVIVTGHSDDLPIFVWGVNEDKLTKDVNVFALGGTVTNGIGPLLKIIDEKYKLESVVVTTLHATTSTQNTVDGPSRIFKDDWRRGRSASNLIPVNTQAPLELIQMFPNLQGHVDAIQFRVPLTDVTMNEVTLKLKNGTNRIDIENTIKEALKNKKYLNTFSINDKNIVSSDVVNQPFSCIYDSNASLFLNDKFIKLVTWFDNEYGYSCRVIDFVSLIAQQ